MMAKKKPTKKIEEDSGVDILISKLSPNQFHLSFIFEKYEYVSFPHFIQELKAFAESQVDLAEGIEKKYQKTLKQLEKAESTTDQKTSSKSH